MPPQLSNAIAKTFSEAFISQVNTMREIESVSWVFSFWFVLCVLFCVLLIRRILSIEAEQRRSRAEIGQILREIRADADNDTGGSEGKSSEP